MLNGLFCFMANVHLPEQQINCFQSSPRNFKSMAGISRMIIIIEKEPVMVEMPVIMVENTRKEAS
ncbi:hypothetical protein DF182_04995 [Chitinophaga flava]|uniref:Uncharacterized protein n=1 Tax=Chitinophaga flava TaxID=2259036 RepID=A0A365Y0X4_9BACT|nr:hypothetical protein DF182_04995 [Chitinophaga flava]